MGKLEDRENRRKSSVIRRIVDAPAPAALPAAAGRGRPKEDRELKKRISLSILPSLYEDIQRIAYIQRRSVSEVVASTLEQYRDDHMAELAAYYKIQAGERRY